MRTAIRFLAVVALFFISSEILAANRQQSSPPSEQTLFSEGFSRRTSGTSVAKNTSASLGHRGSKECARFCIRFRPEVRSQFLCCDSTAWASLLLDRGSSDRIRKCVERLGGDVEWSPDQARELDSWIRQLPEAKRKARLIGSELDAAPRDPRWAAVGV
jgi:hypothetical protein